MRRVIYALVLVLATASQAMAYQSMKQFKEMCLEGTQTYFEGRAIPYIRETTFSTSNSDRFEVKVTFFLKLKNAAGHEIKTGGSLVCTTPRRNNQLTVILSVGERTAPIVPPELDCFRNGKFWSQQDKVCKNPLKNRSLRPQINDIF